MGQQFNGSEGGFYIGTTKVADLDSWDFTIDRDQNKTTAYGDTWKRNKPGLKAWSGKASGRWNMTDIQGQRALEQALLGGTTVSCVFKITDTYFYTGDGFVASENPKSAVDGTVDCDFSITGDGALTPTYGA